MSEKLRLLTEKIYEEGIDKAKQESAAILTKARAEAESMLKEARKEKESILQQAASEAESNRRKVEAEIKLAAVKAGNQLRADIENLLASESVVKPLTKGLSDPQVLRDVLVACVESLRKSEGGDWKIELTAAAQKQVASWMSDSRHQALMGGLEIATDSNRENGFRVVNKNEGYALAFDAAAFEHFLSRYLKPETLQLLTAQA